VAAPDGQSDRWGVHLRTAIIHIPDDQALDSKHARQRVRDAARRYQPVGLVKGDWGQLIQALGDQLTTVVVVTSTDYRSMQVQPEIVEDEILTTMVILAQWRGRHGRHRATSAAEQLVNNTARRWRAQSARWRSRLAE
jgi:hypothetical protein